jgi:hypothetical protein
MIIACVALFFAMSGAGYAAQHYLVTSVHQIKPSVVKQLRHSSSASSTDLDLVLLKPVYSTATPVPAGQTVTVTAQCPTNVSATTTGGGFVNGQGLTVSVSAPTADNGFGYPTAWEVTVTNPTGSPITAQAVAMCAYQALT